MFALALRAFLAKHTLPEKRKKSTSFGTRVRNGLRHSLLFHASGFRVSGCLGVSVRPLCAACWRCSQSSGRRDAGSMNARRRS
jgi:hypothetical protein